MRVNVWCCVWVPYEHPLGENENVQYVLGMSVFCLVLYLVAFRKRFACQIPKIAKFCVRNVDVGIGM